MCVCVGGWRDAWEERREEEEERGGGRGRKKRRGFPFSSSISMGEGDAEAVFLRCEGGGVGGSSGHRHHDPEEILSLNISARLALVL